MEARGVRRIQRDRRLLLERLGAGRGMGLGPAEDVSGSVGDRRADRQPANSDDQRDTASSVRYGLSRVILARTDRPQWRSRVRDITAVVSASPAVVFCVGGLSAAGAVLVSRWFVEWSVRFPWGQWLYPLK